MAISTPARVQASYNGIIFPSNIRTKVAEEAVYSGDNRTVKYSRITIDISGYWTQAEADAYAAANNLAAGLPLDSLMKSIRLKLHAAGRNLIYVNKGYGVDLNINQSNNGGIRDVAMGPRPSKFQFWSLGGAPDGCHGCGFNYTISTCIPECASAIYRPGPGVFTEIYFTVSFETGEEGLVTITTRGALSIPLSLQANNTLLDNVDTYFSSAVAPVPIGFLRRITRELSPDRATCNFTITDRQVEVPFPNNVVQMEMKHSIKQNGIAGNIWDATISGTVRMSPTVAKNLAFARFFAIAFDRIRVSRNNAARPLPNGQPSANIIPPIWEMEEDLFKNEAHFNLRYKILNCTLANIVQNSGLWAPVVHGAYPAADQWDATTWRASLANNAQSATGVSGASFSNSSEVIIDVCNYRTRDGQPFSRNFLGRPSLAVAADEIEDDEEENDPEAGALEPIAMMLEKPGPDGQLEDEGEGQYDPATSWINWQCTVRLITDHRLVRHKPLAGKVTYATPTIDPLGSVSEVAENTADQTPGWTAVPDIIQQTAAPSMILELRGFGVRLAYRVQPPKLISFGGVTPVLAYEDIPEITLGMSGGVVYYRTDWVLRYLLPTAPGAVPLPANPYQGIDGNP